VLGGSVIGSGWSEGSRVDRQGTPRGRRGREQGAGRRQREL